LSPKRKADSKETRRDLPGGASKVWKSPFFGAFSLFGPLVLYRPLLTQVALRAPPDSLEPAAQRARISAASFVQLQLPPTNTPHTAAGPLVKIIDTYFFDAPIYGRFLSPGVESAAPTPLDGAPLRGYAIAGECNASGRGLYTGLSILVDTHPVPADLSVGRSHLLRRAVPAPGPFL